MKFTRSLSPLAVLFALPAVAMAHPGHAGHLGPAGVADGALHPFTGLDHLLALFAVGFLATRIGGRARWTLPAAFLGASLFGAGLSMVGVSLPLVESMLALSVLAGGVLLLSRREGLQPAAMAFAALGVYHGFAHCQEAVNASLGYGAGLGLASLAGILMAMGATEAVQHWKSRETALQVTRLAGAALSVVAVGLLMVQL